MEIPELNYITHFKKQCIWFYSSLDPVGEELKIEK